MGGEDKKGFRIFNKAWFENNLLQYVQIHQLPLKWRGIKIFKVSKILSKWGFIMNFTMRIIVKKKNLEILDL